MPSAIVTWRISTRGRHPTGGRSPVSPAGGSAPTQSRNMTAAFEWAARTDRWTLAGEIMVGAHVAYEAGAAVEARSAHRAGHPGLEADPELVAYLRSALLFIFSWLDDWKAYAAIARVMQRAETAAVRTFGFVAIASSTAPWTGDEGGGPAGPLRMNYAGQGPSIRASTSPWWADGCPTSWRRPLPTGGSTRRARSRPGVLRRRPWARLPHAGNALDAAAGRVCEIASATPGALVAMEALEAEGFGRDDGPRGLRWQSSNWVQWRKRGNRSAPTQSAPRPDGS